MALSFEEAVAQVTGPGGRYELVEGDVLGQSMPVFASTPPSLRALFEASRARGDATFLVYEDERLSFADVGERVAALGHALVHRLGVRPGDRVGIAMRNYPEWVVAFAAITSVGAVAVSYNAWWTTDEFGYAIDDSGTSVLLADRERVERIAPLLDGRDLRVLAVRPGAATLPPGVQAWDDVVHLGDPLPDVEIHLDDDATILYTSGTTGHPKGAVSTHRAVLSALLAFGAGATVSNLRKPDGTEPHPYPTTFILIVPLFHVTGCVPVMLSCFASGAPLVMMYKWNPERALELIERERVTNFVGVPTMSWDLLESPRFAETDTSSLASVGGGGAPAPPELVRRIDRSFTKGRPSIGYGMTETNAYGPGNSGDDYVLRPTSTGRTIPAMQVRVVDVATGEVLAPGGVGEIEFRGPMVIRGYWNKPEATAEAFHDGWLRTGDLGRIDDEGFVYVEDRVKDMVLRGGENVYCAEVEAVLYEHPAVYEAAVFGIPHDRLGEEVAAAVVLRPEHAGAVDATALQDHVGAHLAGFKVPTRIVFLDAQLPRGATGKILKRELRDQVTPVT